MITVSHVSKHYGDFAALRDVSLSVQQGEIVGLLGPNGAGKTTLIRTLTGYFEPSEGSITVDGYDVTKDRAEVQRRIGYLPESTPLYPEMLVQEYLIMHADVRGIGPRDQTELFLQAVAATGLEGQLVRPIGTLSKGLRQRVGLAQAILAKPPVLILDEPTSGLDPTQVVAVRDLIRRLADTSTVLFSTHILSEVEQLCERVVVLQGGEVRIDARLDTLRAAQGARVSVAEETASMDRIEAVLRALPEVLSFQPLRSRGGYRVYEAAGRSGDDLCRALFRAAHRSGWELGELTPIRRDLEAVFDAAVKRQEELQG
jgi:ABC-2 type transport system ATP-binding protein